MRSLQEEAESSSGVTKADAENAVVGLYEKLGGEATLRAISTAFYDRVYEDSALRPVFASATRHEAISNQVKFLTERLGGPKLYTAEKGTFQLISRHAPYAGVNAAGAALWLQHMEAALISVAAVDECSRERLLIFFRFTAAWIVHGRELVNCTRLVGYGAAALPDAAAAAAARGEVPALSVVRSRTLKNDEGVL